MPLSDEDKARILDEERAREEARRQIQAERLSKAPPPKTSVADKASGCFMLSSITVMMLLLGLIFLVVGWIAWAVHSSH